MTKKQISKVTMYDATATYLDANTAIWSAIPIITNFKNELDTSLKQIEEYKEAQEAAKVFLGKNKREQKRLISEKVDILNDTLEAYAAVNEDAVLESKASKNYTDLFESRNEDFKTIVTETIKLLEEYVTELVDYGLIEEQITEVKTSFDNWLDISGLPRQYKIASSVATTSLDEAIDATGELLEKKLDKVMKRFKRSNTGFYKGYLAARIIVD